MANLLLSNPLLRRYWFETEDCRGFGVTAYSLDDAKRLVDEATKQLNWNYNLLKIIEDVDIRNLDESHIIPNMGAPNFRGIWYPNLNNK